jgi:hypothetical protein
MELKASKDADIVCVCQRWLKLTVLCPWELTDVTIVNGNLTCSVNSDEYKAWRTDVRKESKSWSCCFGHDSFKG